jgi:hypothetical protein
MNGRSSGIGKRRRIGFVVAAAALTEQNGVTFGLDRGADRRP